jgi:hypothetical protein
MTKFLKGELSQESDDFDDEANAQFSSEDDNDSLNFPRNSAAYLKKGIKIKAKN